MQCEIISIGDEILIGQVINTNAAWLGKELTGLGLDVRQVTVVADRHEDIVAVLRKSLLQSRWVFVTGGLGPTKDDLTKEALLAVFGGELQFHEPTWQQLGKIYARFGRALQDSHRIQCYLPSSAEILPNAMGTAPCLMFHTSDCRVFVMPGVPFEMEHIMQTHVFPLIAGSDNNSHNIYKTLCVVGIGESVIAELIADIEDNLPTHVHLAYLPALGRVRLRILGTGTDRQAIEEEVQGISERIADRVRQFLYAEDDISLAEAIGRQLRADGKTLSVAESCTGGFLAHLITAISGSSDYFEGGAVTYSNALKQSVLDVKSSTLEQFGAVSEETVREMATGARIAFKTDYAIAVSGVAGPTGGSDDKPVGTVWIAVADSNGASAQRFSFGKDRMRNIELSAVYALDMLRRLIS